LQDQKKESESNDKQQDKQKESDSNNKQDKSKQEDFNKEKANDGNSSSVNASTQLPQQQQQVLKRPVMFTDWSKGMRDPALYAGGIRDFLKVAKKARQQGSLFARKFAVRPPGMDSNNNEPDVMTLGHISTEQWDEAMETLIQKARVNNNHSQ
jgi:hypothetical protein